MSCEKCLSNDVLDKEYQYCPHCGESLRLVRLIKKLYDCALSIYMREHCNDVQDENGEPMIFESSLSMKADFNKPEFETISFDPDKVDISQEMLWLEAHDLINRE